jgi:hypothetical protein
MKKLQDEIVGQMDGLMRVQLSRAEFLQYIGVVLLGVVGVTGLVKNLRRSLPGRTQTSKSMASSYGRGAYGK